MKKGIAARQEILQNELKRILKIIIEEYKPFKVILFGSMAQDSINEWSDIDLLIIKESKKRYLDRVAEIIHLIHPTVGLDIFVLSPAEIKNALDDHNPYIKEIITEGKVVYEQTG
jgi:predicted nucleotidyltransferase